MDGGELVKISNMHTYVWFSDCGLGFTVSIIFAKVSEELCFGVLSLWCEQYLCRRCCQVASKIQLLLGPRFLLCKQMYCSYVVYMYISFTSYDSMNCTAIVHYAWVLSTYVSSHWLSCWLGTIFSICAPCESGNLCLDSYTIYGCTLLNAQVFLYAQRLSNRPESSWMLVRSLYLQRDLND